MPGSGAGAPAARHLYVHVPFCRSRCAYCDFASEPVGPHLRAGRVAAYVAALRAELERESPLPRAAAGDGLSGRGNADRLYLLIFCSPWCGPWPGWCGLGESSPSRRRPTTADERTLAGLREAGATRLSLGVQSFAPALAPGSRSTVHRCRARSAFAAVRDSGFEEWNVDLVFGIPGQSWEQARADLRAAAAGRPTHVSLYDLTYTAQLRRPGRDGVRPGRAGRGGGLRGRALRRRHHSARGGGISAVRGVELRVARARVPAQPGLLAGRRLPGYRCCRPLAPSASPGGRTRGRWPRTWRATDPRSSR